MVMINVAPKANPDGSVHVLVKNRMHKLLKHKELLQFIFQKLRFNSIILFACDL